MTPTWAELYERGRISFGGQTPGRNLEADLVTAYEQHPADVADAIDRIAARYAAGKIHTPWPVVLAEARRASERHTIVASDTGDRARNEHLAERWIDNAGLYEPTEQALVDALFGAHGRLRQWAHDDALRSRIVARWETARQRIPALFEPDPWLDDDHDAPGPAA